MIKMMNTCTERFEIPIMNYINKKYFNGKVVNTKHTKLDYEYCTDFLIDNLKFGLRVRNICAYRDLTIRSTQEGNGKTELDKIIDANLDYYVVAWFKWNDMTLESTTSFLKEDWDIILIKCNNMFDTAIEEHRNDIAKKNRSGNSAFIGIDINKLTYKKAT